MKIGKVTFKNYFDAPSEGLALDHGSLAPTHQGKESVSQRFRLETERLIEGGLEPGEGKIN